MMLPIDLLPSALNLEWGMSKAQCLTLLNMAPLKESLTHAAITVSVQGNEYEAHLQFDDRGGLNRIEIYLHVSQSFWGDAPGEEILRIEEEYKAQYNRLKEAYSWVLGPPAFSGAWGTDGYPEDEAAAQITYWDHPEARVQLEYDHPDKEYPVFIRTVLSPRSRPG